MSYYNENPGKGLPTPLPFTMVELEYYVYIRGLEDISFITETDFVVLSYSSHLK